MNTRAIEATNDQYHAMHDYHSASSLKLFLSSRREYHARYVRGEKQPDKKAFDIGRTAHSLILEPHLLGESVKVIPPDVLASNGAKSGKAWKQFQAEHDGVTLLKAVEMQSVQDMFDAVYANPLAAKLLRAKGATEQSIVKDGGRKFRVRPDKLSGAFIVDLKTTADASPFGFRRSILNYRYYLQAALYKRVCDEHYGIDHAFVFIAVNASPPHQVATYTLGDDYLWKGEQEIDEAVGLIEECHASGDWRETWEKELLEIAKPKNWRDEYEYASN